MAELPDGLRDALDAALARSPAADLRRSVDYLIERYRSGKAAPEAIMSSDTDVDAYAAYRMPATCAAVLSLLDRFAESAPDFEPRSHVDIGGGTGAAVWAAAEVFPSLERTTVLERVPQVISLGSRLAQDSPYRTVHSAQWKQFTIGPKPELPTADLVTMSYVLGELPEPLREPVIAEMAAKATVVVLIEPGTPLGHDRILAARSWLVGAGLTVAAPCPHSTDCPLPTGRDWCHFAARVNRSTLHRTVKGGSLGYEDEKFSYVVATRLPISPAPGRVLRHPQRRKGAVGLTLCTVDGVQQTTVAKSQGDRYKVAKDLDWGDSF
ncbi:rRNA methyltransferase [Pseudonocardiaceae bacterium YIM PH 21723]|nr:rRNA methyltransferase [Pseudonocardiaceae bacterium YIM PH 21723]